MTISPDVAAESMQPSTQTPADTTRTRTQRLRHYVMTRPTFFSVEYAINPWMDTSTTVDAERAERTDEQAG